MTSRVMDGASSASPLAMILVAAISWSGGESLTRNPLAPACSAGFRAAFSRVAPRGYPTGPDMIPLIRVSRELPFKACGHGSGL